MKENITLIIAILALILAVVSFFVKSKTIVEYKEDLRLATIKRINSIEASIKQLARTKATMIEEGNKRYLLDSKGNKFNHHIIKEK